MHESAQPVSLSHEGERESAQYVPRSDEMERRKPYTIDQTAAFLNINRREIYRMFARRELASYTIGSRRFVDPRDLAEFVDRKRAESQSAEAAA